MKMKKKFNYSKKYKKFFEYLFLLMKITYFFYHFTIDIIKIFKKNLKSFYKLNNKKMTER